MRNNIRVLLLAGLITIMAFAFAGCGEAENKSATETTQTEATTEAASDEAATTEAASGYDIMDGFEIQENGSEMLLYGNGFLLTMPNNDKWGYEQINENNLGIYLKSAREDGYGGNLVTIMAFDPDDTSYEEFPAYAVAGHGQNVNKTFIALFPTDVEYDPQNAEQEADYNELFAHVQKIAEGMADSPFQTADSSPQQ